VLSWRSSWLHSRARLAFYWALWQEVQHVLAHLPAPRRRGSPYALWYAGPRADALRGHDPDFIRRVCPACHGSVLSLFRLPRRYGDSRRVCSACYLESVGRSAMIGWRDDEPDEP
jgi:hypothetical protein